MYSTTLKTYIDKANLKALSRIWENPFLLLKKATNIKNLKVLKREEDRIYTRWEVDIEEATLLWYEEDVLDRDKGIIKFKMQEGDFGDYFGSWQIIPVRRGRIKIELRVNYDWGIPVLEPYVRKILERKTRVLLKSFLRVIKETLEENG